MPVKALTLFSLIILSNAAFAKDPVIFDIRRPIAMKNGVQNQKDYFINQGYVQGIKEDMVITVMRRQTMYDTFTNKTPGDLVVAIGQLRIIHVQDNLSVARLENMEERNFLPSLDYDAIMVGDRLDMRTAKVKPRKTASVEIHFEKLEATEPQDFGKNAEVPVSPQSAPIENSEPL